MASTTATTLFTFIVRHVEKTLKFSFLAMDGSKERLLGNATEEDMTFSEIEQIFDRSFVNSSKCITAKRLTIPFTNAESAGSYSCYAKNSYSWTPSTVVHNTVRLKLERSGGTCHSENEISCADGRQCISKNQVCAGGRHCEDGSDVCGCVVPIFVDMKPDEVLLEILESDSFNLTCRAVAFLVPSIKWRVNGTEINCTSPDCQQVSEDGTGTLTLKNVTRQNEGTYTCVAFDDYKVEIISKKEWIVKVVDRKPKEIPQKVEGSVTKLRICV
ncbi:immunoglobulin domain-containing protein [Ditylenchus destructor]|nr:immunoglobulin domain-containing protein [Ditylenchus destructor]